MMNDISIKKAAMINFIAKYINIFIQIIYSAILARILTPKDFGVVAVTSVFTTFFMLFADMGMGSAVIQNKTLTEDDINSIYSFTFYLAIVLAILFALFSIPLSIFYNNTIYKPLCIILSISLFFNTMNMIPNAILMKNKQFKLVGLRSVVVSILSSILTIIFALVGLRYYSIVINSVLTAFLIFLCNYNSVKLKLKCKIDKQSIIKIIGFSSFQFAFGLVNYFARNLDNLLIGKFMGSTALGYYDKAYKLMLYPVGNLTHIISPVLQPILSEYQDDKRYIYDQYMKIVKVLSLLGVFISAYCFFATKEIILIIFGEQWLNAVLCFKILSLSVWAQMITSSTGPVFQSLGNTRLLFITGTINSVISIISIVIGITFQEITIISIFVTISYNLHFIIAYILLVKLGFSYKYTNFIKNLLPDLIIFIICIIGLYFSSYFKVHNIFISAIYKFVVCSVAYSFGLFFTKQYKVFSIIFRKK
jgi:PST family polysaccharide transporter